METIFDHASYEEISEMFFVPPEEDGYLRIVTSDGAYADIYRFYNLKGDTNSAMKYLRLIKNKSLIFRILHNKKKSLV